MRRIGLRLAVVAALCLATTNLAAAQSKRSGEPAAAPVAIEISAQPITAFDNGDASRHRFGALEFRGGLVLTSTAKDFGGISSLRMAEDGARFLAITDRGHWLRGRIVYAGAAPADIVDAELAPIRGPDGRPIAARGWHDSEALAQDGGVFFVGIERVNRILRFNFARGDLAARGQIVPVPKAVRDLPHNKGVEALVFIPRRLPMGGTLVAIAERALDGAGNHRAFLLGGPTPGTFTIKRSDDFDVTDAALLPGGDLVILERRFSWSAGVAARIRRLPLMEIAPDALVEGAVLFEADLGHQIDNMEGLDVHRSPKGEIVLTLISDDNFSILQRTLLLQFALVGE